MHEFDVERASAPRVAVEDLFVGLSGNHLMHGVDQLHGVMNAAVKPQAAYRVVHVRRIAGEKDPPLAKRRGDALVHFVEIAMNDVVAPTEGEHSFQAWIGGFISERFFVAFLNPGRIHRAPTPLTVIARDFEKVGPFIRVR